MNALLILAFAFPDLAITETAPSVDLAITQTAPAARPDSFQALAGRLVESKRAAEQPTACPCGERCECDPCECPNCPHKGKAPHLVASVWSSGCIHGERWLSEAYPELLAKGWRIEVRRVSPDSGVACPTFTMGSRTWSGYTSKAAHFAALRPVESVRVTHEAQRHEAAKPVQTQRTGEHSHVCNRCRTEWWHGGSSRAPMSHNCPNCGAAQYVISRWR